MSDIAITLRSGLSCQHLGQGGEYHVRTTAPDGAAYPMRGGQGTYMPSEVLLVWNTEDGKSWAFQHAIISGPQIEQRTGQLSQFGTTQTVYLNDPAYGDCEPSWLADLVQATAPVPDRDGERHPVRPWA